MTNDLTETIKNLIVPTENVKSVRSVRNDNLKTLNFTEKLNYKLHDKTTWTAFALIGFYIYDKNYTGAVTELFNVIQGAF